MRSNGLHRTVRAPPPGPLAGFAFGGHLVRHRTVCPEQHRDSTLCGGCVETTNLGGVLGQGTPSSFKHFPQQQSRPWPAGHQDLGVSCLLRQQQEIAAAPPGRSLGLFLGRRVGPGGLRWVRSKEQNGEERSAKDNARSLSCLTAKSHEYI